MTLDNLYKGADKYLRHLLHQYFPYNQGTDTNILTLFFLEKLHYDETRKLSLTNEKIQEKWKIFLKNMPESCEEVLHPIERYWRWKMYKKYIPEERTDFRKKMKNGLHFDDIGRFPITGEDLRLYR